MPYPEVEVMGAAEYNGLRVDHPRVIEYAKNFILQGRNNEDICRIVGLPQSVVDRLRSEVKREKEAKKS